MGGRPPYRRTRERDLIIRFLKLRLLRGYDYTATGDIRRKVMPAARHNTILQIMWSMSGRGLVRGRKDKNGWLQWRLEPKGLAYPASQKEKT